MRSNIQTVRIQVETRLKKGERFLLLDQRRKLRSQKRAQLEV